MTNKCYIKTFFFLFFVFFNLFNIYSQDIKSKIKYSDKDWIETTEDVNNSMFMSNYRNLLNLSLDDELRVVKKGELDNLNTLHERYLHYYKNILVEGSEIVIHSQNDKISLINGSIYNCSMNVSASLSEESAFGVLLNTFNVIIPKDKPRPKGQLLIIKKDGVYTLEYKYKLLIENIAVYINANSGKIDLQYPLSTNCQGDNGAGNGLSWYNGNVQFKTEYRGALHYDYILSDLCRNIHTEIMKDNALYPDDINEIDNNDNQWNDNDDMKTGVSAHWAAKKTWDYYQGIFNRTGINNGDEIKVIVAANYNGFQMNNASYSYGALCDVHDNAMEHCLLGANIIYIGDCNMSGCNSMATLDLVGHEFTHGITHATSGLQYLNESGALNESFSDIFGSMVQYWVEGFNSINTYSIGEQTNTTFRSLSNPNLYNCPKYYLEPNYWYSGSDDNGGVHINSGVQNHWFYLLANGGSLTRNGQTFNVSGIGLEKAAAIAYRNLVYYLTSSSDYRMAKNGSIYSAIELYGYCSNEVQQVVNAWNAVNVTSGLGLNVANVTLNCGQMYSIHNLNQPYGSSAIDKLYMNCFVLPDKITTLTAGREIVLQDGFYVPNGVFTAIINPCLQNNLRKEVQYYGGDGADKEEMLVSENAKTEFIGLTLFPNPSNGKISIIFPEEYKEGVLILEDLNGREILRRNLNCSSNETTINLIDFNIAGSSMLNIRVQSLDKTISSRIIVQK